MKKYVVIIPVLLLFACGTPPARQNGVEQTPADRLATNTTFDSTMPAREGEVISEVPVLNKGKKWKTDRITNENAKALQVIAGSFSKLQDKNKTLELYHLTATKLKKGAEKLVSECKMNGPDHDALHVWLIPLLDKIAKLAASSDLTNAGIIYTDLESHLSKYNQYFE